MWRQAQDDAATDASSRLAIARNGSSRLALAGTTLSGPNVLPATLRSHIERMIALETRRFLDDALKRAGRPPGEPPDVNRLREFITVARFFRIEAESQLPERSTPKGTDVTASSRSAAAGQIYQAILDDAARRYVVSLRAGNAPADARSVFDARFGERLGAWSIRWGRVEAGAGDGLSARFNAVRSHLERMASLEDGRALHDALARAGARVAEPGAPSPPREFADVARFFQLEARWELELLKSR